jgi:hypothetical protein
VEGSGLWKPMASRRAASSAIRRPELCSTYPGFPGSYGDFRLCPAFPMSEDVGESPVPLLVSEATVIPQELLTVVD